MKCGVGVLFSLAALLLALPASAQDPQELVLQAQQLHQIIRYNAPPWISMVPLPMGVKEDIGAAAASIGLANSVIADAGGTPITLPSAPGLQSVLRRYPPYPEIQYKPLTKIPRELVPCGSNRY
jgi:hypothetical protein